VNEEWLSAGLDGELSVEEQDELDAALASDPGLAALFDELQTVRSVLRSSAVPVDDATLRRLVTDAEAAASDAADAEATGLAPLVPLGRRRRVPTFAAAAAAMVIIASVVGGLGGSNSIPALGDLVERHEAAAAVIEGDEMPDMMDDMDPMPMDEASDAALPMPADYTMRHAFVDGRTVHLVYRSSRGDAVSVFRHEGDVDVDDLGSGSMASSDEADMWSAPMDGAYVAVVDGSGYVWIVVSGEPHEEMMDDMMYDLPRRSPSVGERLRDVADAAVDPFRLWD
jgi:hypothetical protein